MKSLYMFLFTLFLSVPTIAAPCRPVNTGALRSLISKINYASSANGTTYKGGYTSVTRPTGGRPTIVTGFGGYSIHGANNSYEVSFFRCGGPDDDEQCEQITSERWTIVQGCFYVDGNQAVVTGLTKRGFRFTYNQETEEVRDSYALGAAKRLDVISVRTSPERTFVRFFSGTGVE